MDIEATIAEMDMDKEDADRFRRVHAAAQTLFGDRLTRISTPGGSYRASYRVHLGDVTAIASCRDNFRRTRVEAFALRKLGAVCDAMPRCLGLTDDVLFQSDAGQRRLNVAMFEEGDAARQQIAAKSVEALFSIHRAARAEEMHKYMPPLGSTKAWVTRVVNAVRKLEKQGAKIGKGFNRFAVFEALSVAPRQFVKWDCRSGNAALDDSGKLRWFDFEYCGLRHGAEDFAWLIADESWPLDAQTMFDMVRDAYDPDTPGTRDAWLDYLSLYTVFHALQRLQLMQSEVARRGWKSKRKVVARDDVGLHPDFALQLCNVAMFFADRSRLTAPLVPMFDEVARELASVADAA
ncbi:hypothetical protein [Roseibaca sp. Y0-43]|uniref:hypothetical protein n=1 Tax=Roseibaca sp. Y0-43 TaxID=2816854 RepID=UPI001D0C36D9|nr:hypothetical protein [Roseibaca sp. Y0-43]MCC1480864.1 hypothetical protein [Roseibaca sp. Y0-43]